MAERRNLDFRNTNEILEDVSALLKGHTTAGKWSLTEILNHLAKSVRLSMRRPAEGQATEPTPEQDKSRTHFFSMRKLSTGVEIPTPMLIPSKDHSAEEEAERLKTALETLINHTGAMPAHPYLGPLTQQEWIDFHCIHCAHHLSYAVPLD